MISFAIIQFRTINYDYKYIKKIMIEEILWINLRKCAIYRQLIVVCSTFQDIRFDIDFCCVSFKVQPMPLQNIRTPAIYQSDLILNFGSNDRWKADK